MRHLSALLLAAALTHPTHASADDAAPNSPMVTHSEIEVARRVQHTVPRQLLRSLGVQGELKCGVAIEIDPNGRPIGWVAAEGDTCDPSVIEHAGKEFMQWRWRKDSLPDDVDSVRTVVVIRYRLGSDSPSRPASPSPQRYDDTRIDLLRAEHEIAGESLGPCQIELQVTGDGEVSHRTTSHPNCLVDPAHTRALPARVLDAPGATCELVLTSTGSELGPIGVGECARGMAPWARGVLVSWLFSDRKELPGAESWSVRIVVADPPS